MNTKGPNYPEGVFLIFEVRYDDDDEKESGPHKKHFPSEKEYVEWVQAQNKHPFLHIHVITESA